LKRLIESFEGEVLAKYDKDVNEIFSEVFNALPLAYVLNNKVMVCHGGLFSQDGVTLADIKKVDRFREPPESGIMADILWSDPVKMNGRHPSKRGISIGFGPDIAHKFLNENKLGILQIYKFRYSC
jgi:serine/threonine-protein phosphatase 5